MSQLNLAPEKYMHSMFTSFMHFSYLCF